VENTVAEAKKDTVYIDIDDEITGIIDKVRSSDAKVLALVLPKRASVFQSIVNMKLLKRSADEAKKHIVLITTEAGLLPLAGAVGLHVAKTLASKPEIPLSPGAEASDDEEAAELDDTPGAEVTRDTAGDKPVGELAGLGTAAAAAPAAGDGIETVEMGDDEVPEAAATTAAAAAAVPAAAKAKKNKKLRVPNFERFRLLLALGVLVLILLIVGLIFALKVLPKAVVNVQTDASTVNTSVPITLSTSAPALNAATGTVPAKQVQEQKTFTGTATATGQQNNGQKATGSVVMSSQSCAPNLNGPPGDIPAGTGVSTGGQTYITQDSASFSNGKAKGSCITYTSQPVNIIAQNTGTGSNTSSNATFTVVGQPNVSASGSASGGTDNNQQIVTQADIDSATSKVATDNTPAKQDLTQQLQQAGLYPIAVTFTPGTPANSASTTAGSPASNVTVTETITYTMLGAHQTDLKTLVDANIKSQVNTAQQGILDDGFGAVSFTSTNAANTSLTMATTAEVGPAIDANILKHQIAGKKSGDIQSIIKANPDVTTVTVHFSPFWVSSAPSNTSKITINVAKPSTRSNAASP
jgi:hypothetical protein